MLLVHGLPAHPEHLGDVLPRPPLAAGIGDLCSLQGLGQATQRRGGPQPHSRVSATGCRCQVSCCAHASSLIDVQFLSRTLDDGSRRPCHGLSSGRARVAAGLSSRLPNLSKPAADQSCWQSASASSVSYTHLTLPTNREV